MDVTVDSAYHVDVFLDTNILCDYVLGNCPLLNESLEYLSENPFVRLRSSHYVEFELIEVLKRQEFYMSVKGRYSENLYEKHEISPNWKLAGTDYMDKKDEVIQKVKRAIEIVTSNLKIEFNDHILHKGLHKPSCDITLESRLSREDSMVVVSSVMPDETVTNINPIILTNDSQFQKAFTKGKDKIKENVPYIPYPTIISAKNVPTSSGGVNLMEGDIGNKSIQEIWEYIIKSHIIALKKDSYIGITDNIGSGGKYGKCIGFEVMNESMTLKESRYYTFIFKDLSNAITVKLPIRNGKTDIWLRDVQIDLPYQAVKGKVFSIMPEDNELSDEVLAILKKKGNLVFYTQD